MKSAFERQKKVLVKLIRKTGSDTEIIATCLFDNFLTPTIKEVMNIIENYSKRLVNKTLDDKELAISLFSKTDGDFKKVYTQIGLMPNSKEVMMNNYGRLYEEYDENKHIGSLALTLTEMKFQETQTQMMIYLHIDERRFNITGFHVVTEKNYKENYERKYIDLELLPTTDYYLELLPLCNLEEMYELFSNSLGAFKSTKTKEKVWMF